MRCSCRKYRRASLACFYSYLFLFFTLSIPLVTHFIANLVDPDCSLLTSNDQDNLAEVLHANETWASDLDPTDAQRHSSTTQSKVDIVNMADGAIRRLVKMTKKIASFRALDHHDQLTLLKNTCMEYLILRGAMSYNAKSNVWAGPTPNSGYVVKMDAMKETQANLFESSIR